MTLLTTGKRQRRDELSDHQLRDSERGSRSRDDEGDEGDDELQAHVFRAHFEARFAPLEVAHSKLSDDDERMDARECACDEFESECDSEAGWGGISDEEGEEEKMAVNVVEYQSAEARTGAKVLQGEFKRFMVCTGVTFDEVLSHIMIVICFSPFFKELQTSILTHASGLTQSKADGNDRPRRSGHRGSEPEKRHCPPTSATRVPSLGSSIHSISCGAKSTPSSRPTPTGSRLQNFHSCATENAHGTTERNRSKSSRKGRASKAGG